MNLAMAQAMRGEGSRGGHIIGHTQNGHAIYAPGHANYRNVPGEGESSKHEKLTQFKIFAGPLCDRYRGFSRQDHLDAARTHLGLSRAAIAETDRIRSSAPSPDKVDWAGVVRTFAAHTKHENAGLAHIAAAGYENPFHVREEMMIAKSEGSRGGHVIGHTRSGKPIYGTRHELNRLVVADGHRQNHEEGLITSSGVARQAHLGFTKQDHLDAADHHARVAASTADHGIRRDSHVLAQAHAVASMMMKRPKDTDLSPGEGPSVKKAGGARNGHVIGHTRSGEPIFQAVDDGATRASLAKYTREDHVDAVRAHANLLASGLPAPFARAAQQRMNLHKAMAGASMAKDTTACDLSEGDEVTVQTPAETIKLVDRLVQNMRLAGLDVEVEGTSDGGYSIRRRMGGQPVEIRPDGALRAPEALILFALGDDQALAKAGISAPHVPGPPKLPALPSAPKVAAPVAPKPAGNDVLGKTSTGGTVWTHAKADSPVYRGFSPRDHAQAANLHQLSGNHVEAGAHRAMHAKLTAPRAPVLPRAALSARPKMGMGRLAMSDRREADMVKWESQEVLGEWLGKTKGEGSRGGAVIGHTRSGKPVYRNKKGDHVAYSAFSRQDHQDAGRLHSKAYSDAHHAFARAAMTHGALGNELGKTRMKKKMKAARLAMRHHLRVSASHDSTDAGGLKKAGLFSLFHKPKMPAVVPAAVAAAPAAAPSAGGVGAHGGEGSRGGQIIGHTPSGKPVYASHAAHLYPSFKARDHEHAWQAHEHAAYAQRKAGNLEAAKQHAALGHDHMKRASAQYEEERLRTSMGDERYDQIHGNVKKPRKPRAKRATAGMKPPKGAPAATQAEA